MWGAEGWQNTAPIFKAANSTQQAQVRRMMHPGRRSSWGEWNCTDVASSAPRHTTHKAKVSRWSTYALERMWDMYGHMARAEPGAGDAWPEVARDLTVWKRLGGNSCSSLTCHGARASRAALRT